MSTLLLEVLINQSGEVRAPAETAESNSKYPCAELFFCLASPDLEYLPRPARLLVLPERDERLYLRIDGGAGLPIVLLQNLCCRALIRLGDADKLGNCVLLLGGVCCRHGENELAKRMSRARGECRRRRV